MAFGGLRKKPHIVILMTDEGEAGGAARCGPAG